MVCRIKNRHTFKSLPILNSAYFTECRFVIRHITQTDTETETEANFTHEFSRLFFLHVNSELYEGCGRDLCILGSAKCMSENHTGTRTRCYHGSVTISS